MTTLYQPISRTFGQRDSCFTPANAQDDTSGEKFANDPKGSATPSDSAPNILSPPITPFRRGSVLGAKDTLEGLRPDPLSCHYMAVVPWENLNSEYMQRQLNFLNEYALKASREMAAQIATSAAKRPLVTRKRKASTSSCDSEDTTERVRTRNWAKSVAKSVSETLSNTVPAVSANVSNTASEQTKFVSGAGVPGASVPGSLSETPLKKRRVRKEQATSGASLAAQQAALIDESIPDYSPDANATLPNGNTRALKIEWKGQPMDLRFDPDLEKLHSAEIVLASTLRLRCNVYLDSKRRFFFEKVNRLRNGKPFRRTDAQKACRIDVNKASRLFAAFEKAGWLDDKHFQQYL